MFERLDKHCNLENVIPAQAGIQFETYGFRLKAGMTITRNLVEFVVFIFAKWRSYGSQNGYD
jgi:hypothetical protein